MLYLPPATNPLKGCISTPAKTIIKPVEITEDTRCLGIAIDLLTTAVGFCMQQIGRLNAQMDLYIFGDIDGHILREQDIVQVQ